MLLQLLIFHTQKTVVEVAKESKETIGHFKVPMTPCKTSIKQPVSSLAARRQCLTNVSI